MEWLTWEVIDVFDEVVSMETSMNSPQLAPQGIECPECVMS
jgi:hypothetical protein